MSAAKPARISVIEGEMKMKINNIRFGAYAGLAGGVVFGAMMGMMGMLPMICAMIGQPSALAGFGVHLVISALFGAVFASLSCDCITTVGANLGNGLLYGLALGCLVP